MKQPDIVDKKLEQQARKMTRGEFLNELYQKHPNYIEEKKIMKQKLAEQIEKYEDHTVPEQLLSELIDLNIMNFNSHI